MVTGNSRSTVSSSSCLCMEAAFFGEHIVYELHHLLVVKLLHARVAHNESRVRS